MTWYLPFWQVKWIRVLYSEFSTFTRDQEYLVSLNNTFDYIEGFVIINRTGILNNWRSSFDPKNQLQASQFSSDGKTLYCLEMAKYFNPDEAEAMNQVCHTKQLINCTCMTKIKALIAKKKKMFSSPSPMFKYRVLISYCQSWVTFRPHSSYQKFLTWNS